MKTQNKRYREEEEEEDDDSVYSEEDEDYQNGYSDDNQDDDDDEDEIDEEEEMIKKELQSIPFSKLVEIANKKPNPVNSSNSNSSNNGTKRVKSAASSFKSNTHGYDRSQFTEKEKRKATRESKDSPLETSAKIPVSRFRQAVAVNKPQVRDPRFSNMSGHFNEKFYAKNYGFLETVMKKDLGKLKKKMADKDGVLEDSEKRVLAQEIQKQSSRLQTHERKTKLRKIKDDWEKEEIEKVKRGKNPFYLSEKGLKELEVKQRFKELKDTKQLDKYMEKKRKKISSQDKVFIPRERRSQSLGY